MPASLQNESKWYQMTSMEVAQELQVDLDQGLSTVDAVARLKKYGPNILGVEKKSPAPEAWKSLYWLSIPLTLFVVALLSLLFTSQLGDSLLLAGLAICSMVFAVHWDVKAEINSTSLEKKTLVRRDGQVTEIYSTGLVPGDIVILATGARVPADGRLYLTGQRVQRTRIRGLEIVQNKAPDKPAVAPAVVADSLGEFPVTVSALRQRFLEAFRVRS